MCALLLISHAILPALMQQQSFDQIAKVAGKSSLTVIDRIIIEDVRPKRCSYTTNTTASFFAVLSVMPGNLKLDHKSHATWLP